MVIEYFDCEQNQLQSLIYATKNKQTNKQQKQKQTKIHNL